ncbi:MAG: hypothetical protein K2Z81_09935 [Cyanobacteria bacterium]|nr:hypothetical protein [Cyanobacteriota bacterium]
MDSEAQCPWQSFMGHVPQGGSWIGGPHAFEAAASYLVSAVMLFLTGPGTFSIDAKLFRPGQLVETIRLQPGRERVISRW